MQIYHNKCFIEPIKKIVAFNNTEFKNALSELEEYRQQDFYILGYIRYCAKDIFSGAVIASKLPLLYFEVYDNYIDYIPYSPKKNVNIYSEPQISFEQYQDALTKIKQHIAKGDTYEVNYTYPYKVYTDADNLKLYNYLLAKQQTKYNTFIINDWEEVLSFSPELFFRVKNNKIMTKPMKGTVARGKNEQEDLANKEFLQKDIKNRAENVMIVDLLRNDLSKIAKTGTVNVDKLFEIEAHPTVYQMTSKISAELKANTTLYNIFAAIFPCGSITGAPKVSTMNIIDELEYFPREIYCGAIGYITKNNMEFSVPIRILQKKHSDKYYQYHAGGAIVWDSDIKDEWKETVTKKKILDTDIECQLIETLLIKDGEVKFFEEHLNRLKISAQDLQYCFNTNNFKFDTSKTCMARFLLAKDGSYSIEYRELNKIDNNKIVISNDKMNSKNPYLYHKTTFRPWYKYVLEDYFDVVFFNERGELTEGSRSNIVLQLDGELFTPAVESGLLNGIYRQYLLKQNKIKEKVLYRTDLLKAEKIFCINSVRGMVEVEL